MLAERGRGDVPAPDDGVVAGQHHGARRVQVVGQDVLVALALVRAMHGHQHIVHPYVFADRRAVGGVLAHQLAGFVVDEVDAVGCVRCRFGDPLAQRVVAVLAGGRAADDIRAHAATVVVGEPPAAGSRHHVPGRVIGAAARSDLGQPVVRQPVAVRLRRGRGLAGAVAGGVVREPLDQGAAVSQLRQPAERVVRYRAADDGPGGGPLAQALDIARKIQGVVHVHAAQGIV